MPENKSKTSRFAFPGKIPGHWWGKIIGGALGLMRGGILGAVIGAAIGHFVDKILLGFKGGINTQAVFFQTLFSTLGHLSKADGRVTEQEIANTEALMQRMGLNVAERTRAIGFFNQGKDPSFNLESNLRRFAQQSMLRHDLRQMFIEILINMALADGRLTSAENFVLLRVCRELRISAEVYSAILRAHQVNAGHGQEGQYRSSYQQQTGMATGDSLEQAYAALGLKPSASDQEVKKTYRKLVSQYHPDKLIARGLPEEMMEVAKKRVREINTAYDRIKQLRGKQM